MSDQAPDAAPSCEAEIIAFPNRSAERVIAPFAPVERTAPATSVREAIGRVLRDERRDQGRTLADVADDAPVSVPYLSELERGRKEASSEVLDAVSRSLGLDVADVLERAAQRLRSDAIANRARGTTLLLAA